MRVALLGLGLIGGSVARALRARAASVGGSGERVTWSVAAWTPSGTGPAKALREGVIDAAAATAEEALDGAELVVLAGPAPACLAQLDEIAGSLGSVLAPGAVITDVASTKAAIVLRATALGLRFVGGHPMAGRETSGYVASSADLLVGRPWVVVPTSDDDAVARVEALAAATGARVLRMTAAEHDQAVAAVSHLPLVIAAALVEAVTGGDRGMGTPGWPATAVLAASGWRDSTRLARGDVEMGSGIIATNGPAIAVRVRDLIDVLEGWLIDLERPGGPDTSAVTDRLRVARDRLREMPS